MGSQCRGGICISHCCVPPLISSHTLWAPFWGSSVSNHRLHGAGEEDGNAGHDVQRDPFVCFFQLQTSSCSCISQGPFLDSLCTLCKSRGKKKQNERFTAFPGDKDTGKALKGWAAGIAYSPVLPSPPSAFLLLFCLSPIPLLKQSWIWNHQREQKDTDLFTYLWSLKC